MIFTLYSGCLLKDSYAEVFAPSALESYLNTLPQTTINLDASYPTLYGRIQLDTAYMNSPFEYNYMRIEDTTNDLYYYCFITAIDFLADGLVSVSYAVDIWNTYINKVSLRNSILGNTKYLNGAYGYLPIEYDTLSPLIADEYLNNQDSKYFNKINLVVELQVYQTTNSESGSGLRHTFCAIVTKGNTLIDNTLSAPETESMIQDLITLSSARWLATYKNDGTLSEGIPNNALDAPWTDTYSYYEITNIYTVPAYWAQQIKNFYEMSKTFSIQNRNIQSSPTYNFWVFTNQVGTSYSYPYPYTRMFSSITIANNFKNVSVGPWSNPIPILNNNENNIVQLFTSIDGFNFNLYLNLQGNLYDITPFYSLEMPFTPINGETAQLRRVADREKRNNAIAKIIGGTISEVGNGLSIWTGGESGTPKKTIISRVGQTLSSAGSYLEARAANVNAIIAASANKYQTSYSQSIDVVGMINGIYGLVLFRKANTYNDAEVSYAIDNAGYETNIIVPDIRYPWNPLNLTNIDYNPTRYSYINLYGAAPQNIIKQLESILTSGTKIYYRWQ